MPDLPPPAEPESLCEARACMSPKSLLSEPEAWPAFLFHSAQAASAKALRLNDPSILEEQKCGWERGVGGEFGGGRGQAAPSKGCLTSP